MKLKLCVGILLLFCNLRMSLACVATVTCSGPCSCVASSGTSSGSQSTGYSHNQDCRWYITSSGAISLSFSSFSMEPNYDFVNIYGCTSDGSFCPENIARSSEYLSGPYSTSAGMMQVQLTSDYSVLGSGIAFSWSVACAVTSCGAGSTGPAGSCTSCVAGKYKESTGSGACSDCASGKYSATVGSNTASTCQNCNAGTYSGNGASSCPSCSAGTYSAGGAGSCSSCGAGTYSGNGAGSCTSCPANTNSPSSSATIYSCTCNAGLTGPDGGVCTSCIAGKYKTSSGSVACTDCVAGKYSATVGSNSASTCQNCPANSNSAASSSTCTCNAGFTGPDGGDCTSCVAGKYKTSSGSVACTDCGVNTYSGTVGATMSSVCLGCPSSSNSAASSSSIAECACNAGFTGPNGGVCTSCIAGKYKTSSGSLSCTDCLSGTYSQVSGASSVSVCSGCLAGTYSGVAGASACTSCPSNTFSGASASSCQSCQANSVSTAGSASQAYCYCNSGYAHVAGTYTCKVCDPGTYNSQLGRTACSNCSVGLYSATSGAVGNETCLSCPLGQWSPEGSPSCNLCPANSRAGASSGFVSNCICDAGYTGPNGGPCSACAAGKYKTVTGTSACTNCTAGTYSVVSGASTASPCTGCPIDFYSLPGASSCFLFKLNCTACPANAYYTGGVCLACTGNTTSVAGSGACQCKAGFTGSASNCQACPAGTYKRMAGSSACRTCQANSWSEGASALCACNAGYTGNTGDVCVACVAGKYKNVTGPAVCTDCAANRNSPAAAVNVTSCVCNVGYTQLENAAMTYDVVYAQACVGCAAGKFKALTGVQACTTCAQNQWSVTAMTVCSCVAGFTGPDGGPCAECARGTYKDWLGSQACTVCPVYTNTAGTGSALLSQCVCNTGYTGPDGIACVACVPGKYKDVTGSTSCPTCPTSTESAIASNSISLCQCMPSFTGPDGGPCQQCESGKYKNWPNSSACSTCDANSESTAGMTLCKCKEGNTERPGYTGVVQNNGDKYDLLQACGSSETERCRVLGCGNDAVDTAAYTTRFNDKDFTEPSMGGIFCQLQGISPLPIDFGREKIVTSVVVYIEKNWCGHTFCECKYTVRVGNTPPGLYPATNNELLCPEMKPANSPLVTISGTVLNKFTIECGKTLRGRYFTLNKEMVSWSGAYNFPHELQVMGLRESTACVNCAPGFYKNKTMSNDACTTCPASSYEPDLGATAVTNCSCNAGYEGADGGPCLACPLGKYKDTNGTASCVSCPGDTYIDVLGSAFCKACPQFTTSVVGSVAVTACRCVPGYTGSGGGATALAYSSNLARSCGTNSNQACLATASTIRGGTPSMALDNDVNTLFITEGNLGVDQWFKIDFGKVVTVQSFKIVVIYSWEVDYQRNIKVRVGNVNSYSSLLNPTCYEHVGSLITLGAGVPGWTRTISCTTPLEGQYLFYVNPSGGTNYIEFGEFSPQGLLSMPATPCLSCQLGKYKDSIGSAPCTSCAANTYSAQSNATSIDTCLACPGNSTSVVASMSRDYCQCNVGFSHVAGGCAECLPGTYNPRLAQIACSNCTVGTYSMNFGAVSNETCASCSGTEYSPEGSAVCLPCPANSVAPARSGRIQDCGCIPGYTGESASLCTKCAPGKFKNVTGNWLCESCSVNSYSLSGATSLTACFCNAGFTGAYGPLCVGCAIGKYKSGSSTSSCTDCPANTYADREGMTVCTACVPTSAARPGATTIFNCTCNAGYRGPMYEEVTAHDNFARSCGSMRTEACAATQSSTFSTQVAVGVYDFVNPARSANDNSVSSFSATMLGSSQWWQVDFGRRVTVVSVRFLARVMVADSWYIHVGDANSSTSNLICAIVSVNLTTTDWVTVQCSPSLTGRYLFVRNMVSSQMAIYEVSAQGTEVLVKVRPEFCQACPAGTYKSSPGDLPCNACPANSFSTSVAATNVSTCMSCAVNSLSQAGSDQCICGVDFSGGSDNCTACGSAAFKSTSGPSTCEVCPANSVIAPSASFVQEPCVCVSGFEPV